MGETGAELVGSRTGGTGAIVVVPDGIVGRGVGRGVARVGVDAVGIVGGGVGGGVGSDGVGGGLVGSVGNPSGGGVGLTLGVGWGDCPGGMLGVSSEPDTLGCPLGGPPLVGYGVDPRSKTLPPFDFFPDADLVESFKFDFAFDLEALDFFDDALIPWSTPPCCFDFFFARCRRWGLSRIDESSYSI